VNKARSGARAKVAPTPREEERALALLTTLYYMRPYKYLTVLACPALKVPSS
jgi:hypothetical protein